MKIWGIAAALLTLIACSSTQTAQSAPFILDPLPATPSSPPIGAGITPSLYYLGFTSTTSPAQTVTLSSLFPYTLSETDSPPSQSCAMGSSPLVSLSPFGSTAAKSFTITVTPVAKGSCTLQFTSSNTVEPSSTTVMIGVGLTIDMP